MNLITLCAGTTLTLAACFNVLAQSQPTNVSPPSKPAQVDVTREQLNRPSGLIRTNQLIGRSIAIGENGTTKASVADLLVGNSSGRIDYVIVDRQGAVGTSGERVAVPFHALRWDPAQRVYTLPDSANFANAPALRGDNWNYLSEENTRRTLFNHFGVNQANPLNDPDRPASWSTQTITSHPYFRITELQRRALPASGGRPVAFQDAVIDPRSGQVLFAGMKFDQLEQTTPIPWYALRLDNSGRLSAQSIDTNTLAHAPSFSTQSWDEINSSEYANRVYRHYGMNSSWLRAQNFNAVGDQPSSASDTTRAAGQTTPRDYSEYNRLYTSSTREGSYTGSVSMIQQTQSETVIPETTAITLHSSSGENLLVHLAPKSYMNLQGISINDGDRVQVRGRWIDVGNKKIFVANEITPPGGRAISLRNDSGSPRWQW